MHAIQKLEVDMADTLFPHSSHPIPDTPFCHTCNWGEMSHVMLLTLMIL